MHYAYLSLQYMHGHNSCLSSHISPTILHQAEIGKGIDLTFCGLPAHLPDNFSNLG